ncbi:hypothetical protein [Phytohabitans aurantiacus]|uniref:Uncharacterized protein n=1 Tax=Phytohabitans aurantiacus TaxID=3016789 RepID=A0ABQ5QKZ4_9ACTN|nr:hypothetical protein [Phytohabitans aurantiacus]GLH94923.1 hypothetical protein Pa4123_01950 [Phytohabitans aurantiacus]
MVLNVTVAVIAALAGALVGAVTVGLAVRARRRDDDANIAQILADLVDLAVRSAPPDRRSTVQHLATLTAERWQPDGHHVIGDQEPPAAGQRGVSAAAVNRQLRQRAGGWRG